mgnify:CR=1 FL=1
MNPFSLVLTIFQAQSLLSLSDCFAMEIKKIFLLFFTVFTISLVAQENTTTFGIQFRPLIPMGLLKTDKLTQEITPVKFTIQSMESFNFGMVIRVGFTKSLSLETGINVLKRNNLIRIEDLKYNRKVTDRYTILAYEVPVQGLVYVQLGKQTYMNGSGGISFDLLPSDLYTFNNYYSHLSLRYNWVQMALNANVGFEYRTKKSGYWYLGATLHRPFHALMLSGIQYQYKEIDEIANIAVTGNYLTLDLRYFFNEPADKSKKKKRKRQ